MPSLVLYGFHVAYATASMRCMLCGAFPVAGQPISVMQASSNFFVAVCQVCEFIEDIFVLQSVDDFFVARCHSSGFMDGIFGMQAGSHCQQQRQWGQFAIQD